MSSLVLSCVESSFRAGLYLIKATIESPYFSRLLLSLREDQNLVHAEIQMQALYDKQGNCVALSQIRGRVTIHRHNGQLLAEVDRGAVFTTDGRHVGWFIQNQVFNRSGRLVLASQAMATSLWVTASQPLEKPHADSHSGRGTMKSAPYFQMERWATVNGLLFFEPAAVTSAA